MHAACFDHLTRSLFAVASRRTLLASLATAVGVASIPQSSIAARKKKRKELRRNDFGCVDVGGKCRGKDGNCCSGLCQGKKPKKGEKDKSRCAAHDTGTLLFGSGSCPVTDDTCGSSPCRTTTGNPGECHMTTGNAPYCLSDESNGTCIRCAKDADCQPFCGPRAACIRCTSGYCGSLSTMCAGTDTCTFP